MAYCSLRVPKGLDERKLSGRDKEPPKAKRQIRQMGNRMTDEVHDKNVGKKIKTLKRS